MCTPSFIKKNIHICRSYGPLKYWHLRKKIFSQECFQKQQIDTFQRIQHVCYTFSYPNLEDSY